MDQVTFEDAVMQEEIFGPILPVMTFHSLDAVISQINRREHPLALYMFTESKANADHVMTNCGFGGGCINDTVIHLATSEMGFGGLGESGMGAYHARQVSIPSVIIRVLSTRRHGWIFRCAISRITKSLIS